MQYRAYVIGNTGQPLRRYEFMAGDDEAALEHANRYVRDKNVEVRQRERVVGTLPRKPG
jgi:hypothetical protein